MRSGRSRPIGGDVEAVEDCMRQLEEGDVMICVGVCDQQELEQETGDIGDRLDELRQEMEQQSGPQEQLAEAQEAIERAREHQERAQEQLEAGEPRIEMSVGEQHLTVNPYMMEEGEAELVAQRLNEIFSS